MRHIDAVCSGARNEGSPGALRVIGRGYAMASHKQKIAHYRQHAAQCIAIAQTAPDTPTKLTLLEIARGWLLLAEQADKNSETVLVYETPPHRQQPQDE